MNEAETRAHYIDPALRKAGWDKVEGSRIRMEFPITQGRLIGGGQRSAPSKADYVLQYKGRNLAVIEAKSDEKGLGYQEPILLKVKRLLVKNKYIYLGIALVFFTAIVAIFN